MSFLTTKIANQKGRIGRLNFFLKSLLVIFILGIVVGLNPNTLITIILIAAGVIIPYINLLYSRSHDINRTGNIEVYTFMFTTLLLLGSNIYTQNLYHITDIIGLLGFIGFIGVFASYIYLLFKKGTSGENKYGTDPLLKTKKK